MRRSAAGLAGLLLLGAPPRAAAQPVVAVLSSESPVYREALLAFHEAYGAEVPTSVLGPGTPRIEPGTRVVVTFGARAALRAYPRRVTVVYSLAPGARLAPPERVGPAVSVQMLPPARDVLLRLRRLQPALDPLLVLWSSPALDEYRREFRRAAEELGLTLIDVELGGPEQVPDLLRRLKRRPGALWIPPDPRIVTPEVFEMLRGYAAAKGVPLYAPTSSLAEAGAAASVGASVKEIGRATADAVRRVEAGEKVPDRVFPERVESTVNLRACAEFGLRLSSEALRSAERVLP